MDAEDLTARARIRNAALAEFAKHGFRGASIRGIANAAGVSPGLVQHHFGSKDALQRACDAYVLETLRDAQHKGFREGALSRPDYLASLFAEMGPIVAYMMTSLTSGSETAGRWFDEIVDYVYEVFTSGEFGPALQPDDDPNAVAAVLAAMGLGVTVFYDHLRRVLDDSRDESELMLRVSRARLFITSDRVMGQEAREQLQKGLDLFAASLETSRRAGDSDEPEQNV